MSDDRNVKAGLGIKLDRQEQQAAVGGILEINDALLETSESGELVADSLLQIEDAASGASGQLVDASNNLMAAERAGRTAGTARGGGVGAKAANGGGAGGAVAGVRALSKAATGLGGEAGAAAGQISGIATELPMMVSGMKNLQSGIGGMASSIGVAGAVGGIAAIGAVAALTFVMGDMAKKAKEAEEAAREQLETFEEAAEARTNTTEQLTEEIAALDELIAVKKESIEAFKDVNEEVEIMGITARRGQGALNDQTKELADLEDKHRTLTEALESEAVAANDAREALLDNVDQIGELRRFESAALKGSAEENRNRLEAIQEEKAILSEQIAALKSSGDTSKEVQDKLKELNGEMDTLDKQTSILTSDTVKAAEAQNQLSEAMVDNSAELAKIAELESKRHKNLFEGIQKVAVEERKAAIEIAEIRNQGLEDWGSLIEDQQDADLQRAQDHEDDINRIREEGNEDAEALANDFKFLEAARKRIEIAESGRKAKEKFSKEEEIAIEAKAKERESLMEAIKEEQAIKQQQIEQDLEQKRRELVESDIQANKELQAARMAGNKKLQEMNEIAQQEVTLASSVGQAQIEILQQVVAYAQQSVKGLSGIFGGSAGGGGAGGITNMFNFPNGGTSLANSNLTAQQQQQVAKMMAIGSKLFS